MCDENSFCICSIVTEQSHLLGNLNSLRNHTNGKNFIHVAIIIVQPMRT